MNTKHSFILGAVCGAVLFGGIAAIAESELPARLTSQIFYLKDKPVELEAYSIGDHNYVKLRDIAALVNFSVEYHEAEDSVTIDGDKPYLAEPISSAVPAEPSWTEEMNRIYDRYYQGETPNAWTNGNNFPLNTVTQPSISLQDKFAQNYPAIKAAIQQYIPPDVTDEQEKLRRALVCVSRHLIYNQDGQYYRRDAQGKIIGVTEGYAEDFIDALLTGKRYPTTCGGYAAALTFVSAFAELPCVTLIGDTPLGRHAWNAVYLDGAWRQVDNPSCMYMSMEDELMIGPVGYYNGRYRLLSELAPEIVDSIPEYSLIREDDRIAVVTAEEPKSSGVVLWSSYRTEHYTDNYAEYTAKAKAAVLGK